METTPNPAELAACIAPLDDEGRRAVRRYWEQVIKEEWVPPVRFMPRSVSWEELDERRARRNARRAMARIAQAAARRAIVEPAVFEAVAA